MTAKMTYGKDLEAKIGQRGWVSVNDPACGAGALLVAFANECRLQHTNYQTSVLFAAQDIDHIVGCMCYIQLSLLGCPGYVVIGNSLTEPCSGIDGDPLIPVPGDNIWYGALPPEVEKMFPDYSIYPQYHQAIGFLTRGCVRACEWCIVPRKEGTIRPAATWEQLKRPDSRELVLMDNNVLACGHGLEQIERMGREEVWVDFNQGLDARLITPDIAALLAKLKWIRYVRLACDTSAMVPVIEQAAAYLREAGISSYRLWSYVLVQDVAEAHRRVLALDAMGIDTFAQPYRDYDGGEPTAEQRAFARWVNVKSVHYSCTWENYADVHHKKSIKK